MAEALPRIGVTMRLTTAAGYDEIRDSLACDWPVFLEAAMPEASWLFLPNLVILSGGEDPGVHQHRDETEMSLLDWAEEHGRPVLGICRGMQLMALRSASTLVPVSGHVAARHVLNGEIAREVNSFHTMGLTACPKGFRTLAKARDGSIEAIGHRCLPWEGWMWHPEREALADTHDVERTRKVFGLT